MDLNNYGYGNYQQPQMNYGMPQMRQQFMQQPQQNIAQPQMQAQNPDDRIWIQGRGAAEAYLIAPNGFARLWDTTAPVFYEKRADASGRPSMEEFEYSKRTEVVKTDMENNMKDIDIRFEELSRRIEKLESARRPKKEVAADE